LRAKIILDGWKPKVGYADVARVVREAGTVVTQSRPDFGVVVGGDGIFSKVGSSESVPLLFVGARSPTATGSKAYLAAVQFEDLGTALKRIESGDYRIVESRRLEVLKNRRKLGAVFTDVYLQRGADSNCIRYTVKVTGKGLDLEEAAISDGVVVTTAAGSTGYYSYPDRVRGNEFDPAGHTSLGPDEVGICHILPTYIERIGDGKRPLRYTVPWGCRIEVSMTRPADARLYGPGGSRIGVKVSMGDVIVILQSYETTKVIAL
jgi:hypothetical protein